MGDPMTIIDDWANNSSYKTNSLYVNGDGISHFPTPIQRLL